MADLSLPYVQGITFLGGEPLLNTGVLLPLSRKIRERFGRTKDIWCWTGYTWEELMREGESPDKRELLEQIDILVDGRYIKDLHDSLLQFRAAPTSASSMCPSRWKAGRWCCGRNYTIRRGSFPKSTARTALRGRGSFLNGFERFVYGRLELGKLTIFVV